MWDVVPAVILAAMFMQAQTIQDLLLPEARRFAGVVVDPDGKPVAGAQIDHSNHRQAHETDAEGKFTLDTRAPSVVMRKAGFRSELVRTQGSKSVQVILRKLEAIFPICSDSGRYEGIEGGWGGSFRFSRLSGVIASPQIEDADYGARRYHVDTEGLKGILHGSGPLWSFGTPSDLNVWRSVEYEEAVFDAEGVTIIDARGKLRDGNRWRYLGKFGESASYSDVDEATATILDQFLDGACLKKSAGRR
jgi:hypothetical protein